MMKGLIINGSPRKGNTWWVAQMVKETMLKQNPDIIFEEIQLGKTNIPLCVSCKQCFLKGEKYCMTSETVGEITKKMEEVDFLILTSPVYALQVSAHVKNLFDHIAYYFHRPFFFGKKALVLSTTVGGGAGTATKYMRDTLCHFGYSKVYRYSLTCQNLDGDYIPTSRQTLKINKISERLYSDLDSGRKYSPGLKRVFYYNLWRAMAATATEGADREYWMENDMLDSSFSEKVRANFIERSFGNLTFAMMKKVVG
jgi:multimeric flavodoxin WrbA